MNFTQFLDENYAYTSSNKKKEVEPEDKNGKQTPEDKGQTDDNEQKKKLTSTGNEEYNAKLTETFDTDMANKLRDYIIDACKEMKISIRAVEFEDNSIQVHYNYASEAPEHYRNDKNELAKDIKEEVTDILKEQKFEVKTVLRSTLQEDVGTLTFIIKK